MKSLKPIQKKKKPTTKKLDPLLKSKKKSKKSLKSKPKKRSISQKPKTRPTANLRQAKGWKEVAPKGKEREDMLHRCGSICFLIPAKKKFPVCKMSRRCSKTKGCGCVIDHRGVVAAKFRAKQWGYGNVEKKADELLSYMDKKGLTEIKLVGGKTLESIFV